MKEGKGVELKAFSLQARVYHFISRSLCVLGTGNPCPGPVVAFKNSLEERVRQDNLLRREGRL